MKWVNRVLQNNKAVYLLAVSLCLLGMFSLFSITLAPFPELKFNQLEVRLTYPGANASAVQSQVTDKVVRALRSVSNVERIRADTVDGLSQISLTLSSIKPYDLLKTQIKILQAIAASNLPSTVPQAEITQSAGMSGLVTYVFLSDQMSSFELNNYIKAHVVPQFKSISGVSVDSNQQNAALFIRFFPDKLAQYHINTMTLAQNINAAFSASALGKLYVNKIPYTLGLNKSIDSIQGFKHIVVGYQHAAHEGMPVYLSDIASVEFSPQALEPQQFNSYNGHRSNQLWLYTRSQANPFKAYHITQRIIAKLATHFPKDLNVVLIHNQAKTMHESFTEVIETIFIASVLVLLISFLFLGRLRTTFIPIFTIPVCLLGTVALIDMLGGSLNILTLLALVIAVGLVVDDAIVVVENITRCIEQGMPKRQAIVEGTADIAKTIVGITATLLAVYLPIVFCSGIFAILLKGFAVPLAAAVFLSGIVALTLTPVMCVLLVSDEKENRYQRWFNARLQAVITQYQAGLQVVLRHPVKALCMIVILIGTGSYAVWKLPRDFFPNDPNGQIDVQLSSQASVAAVQQQVKKFALWYQQPSVKSYSVGIQRNQDNGQLEGYLTIQYKQAYLHHIATLTDRINHYIKDHRIKHAVAIMDKFSNMGAPGLRFAVAGQGSVKANNDRAQRLTKALEATRLFSHVSNSVGLPKKQMTFTVDAALAARFGLYVGDIKQQLALYFGGTQLSNYFKVRGLSVPVIIQADTASLREPAAIETLKIFSPVTQRLYPLSKFVSLHLAARPVTISTLNGLPSVYFTLNLAKGVSMGQAIPVINQSVAQYVPDDSVQYFGGALLFLEGNSQTLLIAGLGLVCIYFLLALLFNSMVDPLIILLTVPFSVVGGALSLYGFGDNLNLYSTLALITLVGLITKHGVLIVQFANQALRQGASVQEAIIKATRHRFRPIIMTTLAMTLGALPLLISQGVMYVARRDLGAVLISGLLIGTLFSLFIVPLVYSLVKKAESRLGLMPS